MPTMTGLLPLKRPLSAVGVVTSNSVSRRRMCRPVIRRTTAGVPALSASFQDNSHELFYSGSRGRRRGSRQRGRRDMSCGMAPSPQSFCGTSSAPGLEFLAELAGDFGTMSEEKKGQSSSSSSSSSSEEEETAEEMARKMQKKEMKAAKKMRKAEEKQMKRRMEEGAAGRSEDMQCSTALLDAPESPAAMDVSYAPADSSLIIHQGRGESVIMRMAASPDGLVVSDRESPQTRSQLLVCQGSACRKRGAVALKASLQAASNTLGMTVDSCKCLGMCKTGPHVRAVMAPDQENLGPAAM